MREWNKEFDGINAYDLAQKLGLDHNEVRKTFQLLKKANKGTLQDDVILRPTREGEEQTEEVVTTIFYPSKECLEMNFSNQMARKEAPEFKRRLFLGHKRSELIYFTPSVLNKYQNSPEKYNIHDSLCGGFISSNDQYLSNLSKEHKDRVQIKTIRYGKRKIKDKKQVVTAVLEDLSQLPEADQQHWLLAEIEKPRFSLFDPDFHKYHLKFFNCYSVDTYNPLKGLYKTLSKINSLPQLGKLFNNINISDLNYPVTKTYHEFSKCCDKLYDLIGPENLNREVLQSYLQKNYNYSEEDFFDSKTGESLTNEQLFKTLLTELGFINCSIYKLMKAIKKHKIPEDHLISNSRYQDPDYLTEYRKLCQSLLISFCILYQTLDKQLPVMTGDHQQLF